MKLSIRETALFAVLGSLMYASKLVMEFIPNVHIIAPIIVATTIVFGVKALYPLYIFVFLTGLFGGFSAWWIPYLYIWTVLWGAVMLLPKRVKNSKNPLPFMIICALHGFLYGTLYAPAQAIMFGYNMKQTLAWIAAGLPFDALHGVSNFVTALLVLPLVRVLRAAVRGQE